MLVGGRVVCHSGAFIRNDKVAPLQGTYNLGDQQLTNLAEHPSEHPRGNPSPANRSQVSRLGEVTGVCERFGTSNSGSHEKGPQLTSRWLAKMATHGFETCDPKAQLSVARLAPDAKKWQVFVLCCSAISDRFPKLSSMGELHGFAPPIA